jgi:hypothetical protein
MLRGLKPLAAFTLDTKNAPACLVRYLRMFDGHAVLGRFVRRERMEQAEGRAFRRVLYALPGEEWRMDSLLELHDGGEGWTAERERREGLLLGYTETEISIWLDHLQNREMF